MPLRLLASAALLLALAHPVHSQRAAPDPATVRASRALLLAMKADSVVLVAMEQAMAKQRENGPPQLPPLFFDRMVAAVRTDLPVLVDDLALIYARHFTLQELEQLTVFYRTPLGQRMANESGAIGMETSESGQRWGAALAMRVMGEMIEKGEMQAPR
ncbi:MAG: DUF2059 domain-containing protein [Gemmatimonadales bacterium]